MCILLLIDGTTPTCCVQFSVLEKRENLARSSRHRYLFAGGNLSATITPIQVLSYPYGIAGISSIAASSPGYACMATQTTLDNSTTTTTTLSTTGCSISFTPQLVPNPRIDTFSVQISRQIDDLSSATAVNSTTSAQNVTVDASVSVFHARMTLETNSYTLRRISPNACSANATSSAAAAAEASAGNFTIPTYQTVSLRALAEFDHPDVEGTLLSADVSCCVPISASGGSGSGAGGSGDPASVLHIEGGALTATGAVENAVVSIDPASGTSLYHLSLNH